EVYRKEGRKEGEREERIEKPSSDLLTFFLPVQSSASYPAVHSGIVKLFATVTASPENAGTLAERKIFATHPPTEVPPNGPSITFALVARPVGENVTCTLPLPVGPSSVLHDDAEAEAASRAAFAALVSKGGFASSAGGSEGLSSPDDSSARTTFSVG